MTEGLADSEITVHGEIHTGAQEHMYMETQSTIAIPGEDQEITVICSTQSPDGVMEETAKILGVAKNKALVKVKRVGGGFGGKSGQHSRALWPAVVAANKYKSSLYLDLA